MSDDLISRKAVIDILENMISQKGRLYINQMSETGATAHRKKVQIMIAQKDILKVS